MVNSSSASSLSDQLAALSPEQLAALRSQLTQRPQLSSIQPRDQVSDLPEKVRVLIDGKAAWQGTSTQARLWFLEQLLGPNPVYNIVRSLRLSGPVNLHALESSLSQIVQRHEALRTTFHNVDGVPYQVINANSEFKLDVVDLQASPAPDQALQRQLTSWGQQPFDLTKDCLLRAVLFQLGPQDFCLSIAVHHLVGDGWSLGLFADELSKLYRASLTGQPNPLPPLSLQFADYSLWLHRQLRTEQQQKNRRYWQQQLSGSLPVLNLPYDQPRGSAQTYQGRQVPIDLDSETVRGLKTLGNQASASLFMVLLASFKVLLHRYSGQTDIIVGSPFANRSRPEFENIFGYFVDNLPLRTDLSGNPSFWSILQQVQQTSLEAYGHAYPFAEILDAIHVTPDHSSSPVFSVVMGLQNTLTHHLELPDVLLSSCRPDGFASQTKAPLSSYRFSQDIQVARFDLTLLLKEEQGVLSGRLEYNQDLFDSSTSERLINHWYQLIQGLLANPHCPINQLPLLSERQRHQLLVEWNNTQTAYAQDKCIHQLFEDQVERSPEAIAVVFDDQPLTYQALNRRANQLAHDLQGVGVGPDVLVGLCVEPSLDMMVGILAILKAGGAYVPLDPDYPSARLAYILSDTSVPVLLTQKSLQTTLPPHAAVVIHLDDYPFAAASDADQTLSANLSTSATSATSENLAYVIYTSGSTGQPKGVLIQHQGVCNLAQAKQKMFQLTENKRCLQSFSLSFDGSVCSIFSTLISGATLYLVRKDQLLSGEHLVEWLHDSKINVVTMPPALLSVLPPHPLPHLTTLVTAGEACLPTLVEKWGTNRQFFNAYGPTETTVCATIAEVTTAATHPPIGYPIANTQTYILDTSLQPVPIGVSGELFIGGDGLARGYLNRPDLTAERFIPNPFSDHPEARLYKTGDLVRYLPDGQIEYLGRIDHQVKIRGFRIELGEIESVLAQHPHIRDVVVVAREDQPGDRRLVAYVTVQDGEPSAAELYRYLNNQLPGYMIPSAFVVLEGMPLTANGKVDRRALPKPDPNQRALDNESVVPRTPTEERLGQIWCDLLKLDQVGIHDNFFELGGHSLLATQVISRIRTTFEIELPLQTLFEMPTIAEICDRIETTRWAHQSQPSTATDSLNDYEEGVL